MTGAYSGGELGRLFGVPVHAKLPDAARELDEACVARGLLGANSDYRIQIANLTRRILGLPDEKAAGPVAYLRSFADKFRRNNMEGAALSRT